MTLRFSRLEKIMGGIILALILLSGIREGCNNLDKNKLIHEGANYKDSAQHYSLKVGELKVLVATNKSLVLENDKQIKSVLSSMNDTIAKLVRKFKEIKSGTIINNYTTINNDTIKLHGDSIPCDFKPFKVRRDSIHYKFTGTIAKGYFSIDTLKIPNKISLIIGREKVGFLKYEDRAAITNSNPLVHTSNIGNYEVIKRKKRIGLGVSAGYGLSFGKENVSLRPSLNLSVNYNLLEL